jgi:hypothetical protein
LLQALDQERTPTDWIQIQDHYPQNAHELARAIQRIVDDSGNRGSITVMLGSNSSRFRLLAKPASLRRYIYEEFVQEPLVGKHLRQRILDYVMGHPGFTATQIATTLRVTPASVASVLSHEYKAGNLTRNKGEGPRGGFTYYPIVPPEKPKVGLSIYERIRTQSYKDVDDDS